MIHALVIHSIGEQHGWPGDHIPPFPFVFGLCYVIVTELQFSSVGVKFALLLMNRSGASQH